MTQFDKILSAIHRGEFATDITAVTELCKDVPTGDITKLLKLLDSSLTSQEKSSSTNTLLACLL